MKRIALLLANTFMLAACAGPTISVTTPQIESKLLDTRFSEIVMEGRVIGVIDRLFHQLRVQTPHKNVSFGFELDASIARQGWGPNRTYDEIERHNARVSIRLRDVALRQVLDSMTSQAGWDYYVAPHAIMFVAGQNVIRSPHVQSSWAGSR